MIGLGLEYNKINMCSFNLRDRESGLLHRKGTCITTDSPGISETLHGKVCHGGHQHQPLEGKNAYGSRCQQAGKYTVEFCKTIVKGVQ